MRLALGAFFSVVLVAMLWVTAWASLDRSVFDAGEVWRDPWGRATLFDAYFGFLTFYLWVAWRERSAWARGAWLLAILALGNIAMASYMLVLLARLPPAATFRDLLCRRAGERGPA